MIKRINDDRLSEVNGGGSQSDPTCFCSVVCSCNQGKQSAKNEARGVVAEFRSFTKNA